MIRKPFAQLYEIIATLMIFIMMMELTGCYSTRIIQPTQIDQADYYQIRFNNSTWSVYNVILSEEVLSGNLDYNSISSTNRNNIYLSSDSLFKINNNKFSVPVSSVSRIELVNFDQHKTRVLTAVIVVSGLLVGLTIIATIAMANAAEKTAETAATTCNGIK